MKHIITSLFAFVLFLDDGFVCWSRAKYQTDYLLTHSEVECLPVPLVGEGYECVEDFLINYLEVKEKSNGDK